MFVFFKNPKQVAFYNRKALCLQRKLKILNVDCIKNSDFRAYVYIDLGTPKASLRILTYWKCSLCKWYPKWSSFKWPFFAIVHGIKYRMRRKIHFSTSVCKFSLQEILNSIAVWISDGSSWSIKFVDSSVKYKPINASSYI